jgi:asparagine synthase (glutamine-hydrolysing)
VLSTEALDRMTDMMTHRGPNDRGTYLDEGIALGVRRLSIVDVEGGHQPVSSEDDRIWAIQNGELYNHEDLRRVLEPEGHVLRSHCDTEILPHLYERFGVGFAEQLRGKFAIAVWDGARRRAVLARDRLGVKPLYYAVVGDVLLFASELKSLLASNMIPGELDYDGIDAYLTFGFVPAPRTVLAGVSKLLPGHRLVVENGTVATERYWAFPEPVADSPSRPAAVYAEELLSLLEESVRLRLMSDVPLGAMLSGGIDSSLIVALMARNMTDPVKTFSVGFRDDPLNELADARSIAHEFGTDHHELELSFADDDLELEQLVWHLDEPVADLSSIGFLRLSELAAEHVTVALSGQGADELLGGYGAHRTASFADGWSRVPLPLRRGAELVAAHGTGRSKRAARLLASGRGVERIMAVWDGANALDGVRDPAGPLGGANAGRRAVEARLGDVHAGALSELMYVDAQLGLVDDMLHYFDRTSMAHSLEVRVPILDHHVVELCARIPNDLKVQGSTTKHILKLAARGLVPDRTIAKKKIGFAHGAVGRWVAEQAGGEAARYLLGESPRYAEFLRVEGVRRLAAEQASTRGYAVSQSLLRILILEVWLSVFVPRATARREFSVPGAR